jgi:hypothetical protein
MQHPPPGGVSLSREDSHRKPVDELFMGLLPPLPVPPHQVQHLGPRSSQRDTVARLQVLNPMVRFPEARVADPDSIGSVDPDSGYGSRRAKMTHKSREKIFEFMF